MKILRLLTKLSLKFEIIAIYGYCCKIMTLRFSLKIYSFSHICITLVPTQYLYGEQITFPELKALIGL